MIRTKLPQESERVEAQALLEVLKCIDPARRRIAKALEQAVRIDEFDYASVMLAALIELQEETERAGDRDLVQLLTPAIMLAYLRAVGHDRDRAIQTLRRLHGVVPSQNAVGASSVQ